MYEEVGAAGPALGLLSAAFREPLSNRLPWRPSLREKSKQTRSIAAAAPGSSGFLSRQSQAAPSQPLSRCLPGLVLKLLAPVERDKCSWDTERRSLQCL